MLQQALDLAAKQQLARVGLGVIERFDAENIPCTVHFVGFRIPHDKGKHTAQLGSQCRAVFLIAVDDDLGVAVGLEDMALGLQFGTQIHEVVNFAVEHADNGAVLVVHRLLARGQVNDAQAAEAQRNGRARVIAADVVAFHIGTAVDDAIRHFVQDGLALFT